MHILHKHQHLHVFNLMLSEEKKIVFVVFEIWFIIDNFTLSSERNSFMFRLLQTIGKIRDILTLNQMFVKSIRLRKCLFYFDCFMVSQND